MMRRKALWGWLSREWALLLNGGTVCIGWVMWGQGYVHWSTIVVMSLGWALHGLIWWEHDWLQQRQPVRSEPPRAMIDALLRQAPVWSSLGGSLIDINTCSLQQWRQAVEHLAVDPELAFGWDAARHDPECPVRIIDPYDC
jgi:hypothetical protein